MTNLTMTMTERLNHHLAATKADRELIIDIQKRIDDADAKETLIRGAMPTGTKGKGLHTVALNSTPERGMRECNPYAYITELLTDADGPLTRDYIVEALYIAIEGDVVHTKQTSCKAILAGYLTDGKKEGWLTLGEPKTDAAPVMEVELDDRFRAALNEMKEAIETFDALDPSYPAVTDADIDEADEKERMNG